MSMNTNASFGMNKTGFSNNSNFGMNRPQDLKNNTNSSFGRNVTPVKGDSRTGMVYEITTKRAACTERLTNN